MEQYKDLAVKRIFVVGQPGGSANAASYEGGCATFVADGDAGQLKEGFRVLLAEMASAILRAFESTTLEYSRLAVVASPRQLDAKLLGGREHAGRLKQRTSGRLAKLTGDLYLLAGAHADAVSILVTAAEECKIHGDLAWHAAAQEALQIALILQGEATLRDKGETAGDLLWLGLPDKLREVAPLYHRADLPILAFEIHRSISALLDSAGNAAEAAMALCQGWAVHRQLAFGDKLYVLTVIIDRFEALQMQRKRAFFLQALSALLEQQREAAVALQVLEKTFSVYRIQLDRHCHSPDRCWEALRVAVLRKAAKLSEAQHDRELSVTYHSALLGMGRASLDNEDQISIAKVLRQRARQERRPVRVAGSAPACSTLPLLTAISVERASAEFWRPKPTTGGETGPFIYNPFQGRGQGRSAELAVAAGQTIPIRVTLCNPFAFPIDISDCTLEFEGNEAIDCQAISTSLPPWTRAKAVSILCTPRQPGSFKIISMALSLFGTRMRLFPHEGGNYPPLELQVISEQPMLKLAAAAMGGPNTEAICLVDGQIAQEALGLRLYNFGRVGVGEVALRLIHEWDEAAIQPDTVDQALFMAPPAQWEPVTCSQNRLGPIGPDRSTDLELYLRGIWGWKSTKVIIEYDSVTGGQDTRDEPVVYRRQCEMVLRGTVLRGIKAETIMALCQASPDGGASRDCLIVIDCKNGLEETEVQVALSKEEGCNEGDSYGGVLRLGRGGEGRLVRSFARLALDAAQRRQPIPMEGRQMAALRRLAAEGLTGPPSEDLVQGLDRDWYWTKRSLMEALRLEWKAEDGRRGLVSLVDAQLLPGSLDVLCREDLRLQIHLPDGRRDWPIHSKVSIQLSVTWGGSHVGGEDDQYVIRAFPALYIAEEELGVEIDDLVVFEGSLQQVTMSKPNAVSTHQFSLLAIAPCRARLLVHVQRMSDKRVICHPEPVVLNFG